MNNLIIKILRAKYTNLFVITLTLIVVFSDINLVEADSLGDGIWNTISTIGEIGSGAISGPIGQLNKSLGVPGNQLAGKLLTSALAFDNFFSVGATAGWETVRDFSNLFFALVLLVIAISTVLDIGALSNYSAKRMLPSFITTVLLINFSKSIVAIFVDISQIIMLEFYNAIVAGNGGIHDVLLNQGNLSSLQDNNWFDGQVDALTTNLITFFLLLIVTFVLLWIALTLWVRVATIWILIMTSPLAFMSMTFPPLKSIWSKWMSELQKVLVGGPTLLFYLYLAIVVLRASGLNSVGSGKLDISSYAVSIILFILAKTKSEEAAASAPGFAKNIVNTVGSIATLGLSKPAGVGGNMNTVELFKAGGKISDKLVGGGTRFIQTVTGGKIKANDFYEDFKDDAQELNKNKNPWSKTNIEADKSRRISARRKEFEKNGKNAPKNVISAQRSSVNEITKDYEEASIPEITDEMYKNFDNLEEKSDLGQALLQRAAKEKGGLLALKKGLEAKGVKFPNNINSEEEIVAYFIKTKMGHRLDGQTALDIYKNIQKSNKDSSLGKSMEIMIENMNKNGVFKGGVEGTGSNGELLDTSGSLNRNVLQDKKYGDKVDTDKKIDNFSVKDDPNENAEEVFALLSGLNEMAIQSQKRKIQSMSHKKRESILNGIAQLKSNNKLNDPGIKKSVKAIEKLFDSGSNPFTHIDTSSLTDGASGITYQNIRSKIIDDTSLDSIDLEDKDYWKHISDNDKKKIVTVIAGRINQLNKATPKDQNTIDRLQSLKKGLS